MWNLWLGWTYLFRPFVIIWKWLGGKDWALDTWSVGKSRFPWAPGCLSKGITFQRPQAGSSEAAYSLNVRWLPFSPIKPHITQKTVVSSFLLLGNAIHLSLQGLQMPIYVSTSHCNVGGEVVELMGSVTRLPGVQILPLWLIGM